MILDDIVAHKKNEIKQLKVIDKTQLTAAEYDFCSLLAKKSLGIIAEFKPRSPSQQNINLTANPITVAQEYQQAGADAISVLTDEKYFGGSYDNLAVIRQHCNLPLLCKEFIIDKNQVYTARAHGADACLLIVSILSQQQLCDLQQEIHSLNMTAVVEVFNEQELTRALAAGAKVIQINNRNLHDFSVDIHNTTRLCENISSDVYIISASGIEKPSDVQLLPARANAILIGTALMKHDNRQQFIQDMRGLS